MTAVAKLPEKWRESARGGSQYSTTEYEDGCTAELRRCADELEAALSPAELGGVEEEKPAATVSVVMGRMGEVAPHCVILSDEYEAWLDNQPFGTVHRLYTTPRAAEAVSEAELAEVIQRHTGCADSDSIYAAVAVLQALTPPSAKGE